MKDIKIEIVNNQDPRTKVRDGKRLLTTEYCNAKKIPMYRIYNVNHGRACIYCGSFDSIYNNMKKVYRADKNNMIEISMEYSIKNLSDSEKLWLIAYCYENNISVLLRNMHMVLSFYVEKTCKNLSKYSKKFTSIQEIIGDTVIDYKIYNNNSDVMASGDINDTHKVVTILQEYCKKWLTPNCYLSNSSDYILNN